MDKMTDIERRIAELEKFKRECDMLFRVIPVLFVVVVASFLVRHYFLS